MAVLKVWKGGKKNPAGTNIRCYCYQFVKEGIRFTRGGFRTKREAESAQAEARKRAKAIHMDFGRLCELRSGELKLRRGKQYYAENKKFFEKLQLRWLNKKTISKKDVVEYLNEVAVSQPTKANKDLRLLKALFNFGLENGHWQENPTKGIKPFPSSAKRRYVPPNEDVLKVFAVARPMQLAYLILVRHTLARVREINRLTWDDVHDDYVILRTRKAKNSDLTERKIPLTKTAKTALAEIARTSDFVFTNPRTGRGYDYRQNMMKYLCKKAGVRYFTFHALRHLGASTLSRHGVPITDIQKILGHQRTTTTDIYLRSIGDLTEAMNKLEEANGTDRKG